jgi:hypothetical protein
MPPEIYNARPSLGSITAAGFNAVVEINGFSIIADFEFGGLVYISQDGTYSYTPAIVGTPNGCDPLLARSLIPPGATVVGSYHTHGAFHKPTDNDFSIRIPGRGMGDIGVYHFLAENRNSPWYGFLGTPSGDIRLYVAYPNGTSIPSRSLVGW